MDYIDNLCENYKNINEPIELDIIIEGGLFNGLYTAGSLFLIKKLEKKNYLRVNRISGASVGAILGFYYFCDLLDDFPKDFITIREYFKKDLNLNNIDSIAEDRTKSITKNQINQLNNRLFISYVKNGEQTVKNIFKNNNELKESILKSIQIPYFTTNSFYRKYGNNNYLDGGVPFIFNEREYAKNKYILYLNNSNIKTMFTIKNEENAHSRILEGALDAHNFFLHKKIGSICSYIHEWDLQDFVILRLKQLLYKFLMFVCWIIHNNKEYIIPILKKTYFIKDIKSILNEIFKDFVILKCL